jgi:tripartite-type tricarboxylate transporter receptor subunit TctC
MLFAAQTSLINRGVCVLLGALFGTPAVADTVADFYKGKEVALYVGSSSGGGFDLYGRLVARHLTTYLPGAPTIVVKNMPGAGGIQQVNYLVNVAQKDGTHLGIINPVMTTAPFLTPDVAKWDSRKFVWLGSANSEISTCAFWKASQLDSIDKLIGSKREVVVAGIGPSSGSTLDAITLKSMFGLKWNLVTGYPGLANAMNAAEAGEADGMCGLNVTTLKARLWPQIQRGEIHVLLQTSLRNHPDLPGVKNAFDLAKSPEQKQMMELVFGPWIFGRPFITTPGVPADRLAALRKSFKEVLADPQFLAEAEKTQSDISYMPPSEIEQLVERFYATPAEVREKTRQLLDTRS